MKGDVLIRTGGVGDDSQERKSAKGGWGVSRQWASLNHHANNQLFLSYERVPSFLIPFRLP